MKKIKIVPDARLPFDLRIVVGGVPVAKVYGVDAQPDTALAEKLANALQDKPLEPDADVAIEMAIHAATTNTLEGTVEAFMRSAIREYLKLKTNPVPDDMAYCIGCGTHPKGIYTCATCVAADEHEGPQEFVSDWPE